MKKALLLLPAAVVLFAASAYKADVSPLAIGAKTPKGDLKMQNVITGKETSLNETKGAKGLLVIFSCNTCPYVVANEARIKEVSAQASKAGIGVVIVNSNEGRRSDDDSPESMKKYAQAQGFSWAYVIDGKSELADAFGALRTPECFLFDKNEVLVYHGGIDDNPKDPAAVTHHYLRDAINAVSEGKEVKVKTSRSIGCTIKRAE